MTIITNNEILRSARIRTAIARVNQYMGNHYHSADGLRAEDIFEILHLSKISEAFGPDHPNVSIGRELVEFDGVIFSELSEIERTAILNLIIKYAGLEGILVARWYTISLKPAARVEDESVEDTKKWWQIWK